MSYKDILLALTSYPVPTPRSVIDDAVSIASVFGAHLAAVACDIHIEVPGRLLAGSIAGLPGIIAEEAHKSTRNAEGLVAAFEAAAAQHGIAHEIFRERCPSHAVPDLLTGHARLRDLTIMPVSEHYGPGAAEPVIFASGGPVLVLPTIPRSRPFALDTVVVAWDFSRAATRAASDAMPMLTAAKRVFVLTVENDKPIDSAHAAEQFAKHLARHGVDVTLEKVDADQDPIGLTIGQYALGKKADLLVMGAYGHSRWREFVLGGATNSLLSRPPLPILFSH